MTYIASTILIIYDNLQINNIKQILYIEMHSRILFSLYDSDIESLITRFLTFSTGKDHTGHQPFHSKVHHFA